MSYSSSPSVTVNNTTIYINSLNSQLATLGLAPIQNGATVPLATQTALNSMETLLTTKYNAVFPNNPLPASNSDGGYMGPLSAVQPGTAPACAVNQITSDFANWGLSTTQSLPTTLAEQITTEIVSQGGQPGFASGTHQVTSAESIYWMVGYLTINITQTETGILYVFCASEGINI